ncbi:MAG: mechanosensitive ion channel [Alphaproteobacteria bacterium]|nr:mechanosensitive ion channel [Alphaproteobacteria bacterium]
MPTVEDLQSLLTPETLATWAGNVVAGLAIVLVGRILAGWLDRAVRSALGRAHVDVALAGFLGGIVRYTVIFAAVLMAAQQVGIETTSLMAIFASAGLAVGLALQGSLGNFASGVMILFFRPFTVGEVITVGGVTGGVLDISLFATKLGLPDGTHVLIPNSSVTGGEIRNHVVAGRRRATCDIGVDYGSDLDQVREVLTRAVTSVAELHTFDENPGYGVVFVSFGASSLDWQVHAWFKPEDFLPGQEKVRVAIYKELNAAGIGIPFPQLDLHMQKPAA